MRHWPDDFDPYAPGRTTPEGRDPFAPQTVGEHVAAFAMVCGIVGAMCAAAYALIVVGLLIARAAGMPV